MQLLFIVGEMIGPVVGLYVFGERETLARRDDSISPSGPPGVSL
jgi:hypothetical protein